MLLVVGIIVELIGMYLSIIVIPGFPRYVISLMIISIALIRWGMPGAVSIPVMALCDMIICKYIFPGDTKIHYEWIMILQSLIAFCSPMIIFFFKKKRKEAKVLKDFQDVLIFVLITYFLSVLVFGITQSIIFGGNIVSNFMGQLIYSLLSFVVFLLFLHILNMQNVAVDVKKSLIEKRQEEEKEKEYYNLNDTAKYLEGANEYYDPNKKKEDLEEKKGV